MSETLQIEKVRGQVDQFLDKLKKCINARRQTAKIVVGFININGLAL